MRSSLNRAERVRHPLPTGVPAATTLGRATRRELPTTFEATTPLPSAYDSEVARGLRELGVELRPEQRAAIDGHARLLLAWTEAINLTAIREPQALARMHVIDSLAGLAAVTEAGPPPDRILDLGSGGGYPGIVLAAALPAARVVLVDSVAKKVRFLRTVVAATRMDRRVEAVAARAEALALDPAHRERHDVVVARAVGSLADLVELSMPLLKVGGRLVAWKRGDPAGSLRAELDAGQRACVALGAEPPRVVPVANSVLPDHVVIIVSKRSPTEAAYPRDPATRRRHSF